MAILTRANYPRLGHWRTIAALAVCCEIAAVCASPAAAQPLPGAARPLGENFETAKTSWQFAEADVQYRVDRHRRAAGEGRSASACETLAITAAHGSYLYAIHPVRNCRVVDELDIRLWLKANRSGLQLLARVVLPNAQDPTTGKPLFALVRGPVSKAIGAWEELRLVNLPHLVERQVRVLRAQHGAQVDARGAYVDLVALNIYGGQGQTQVWIDDLQITGAVEAAGVEPAAGGSSHPEQTAAIATPERAKTVRLSGTVLSVDGRPVFPRVVEHQGEPLALLAEMGFNGVRVSEPPSAALLAEAEQAGMWIVAPPPALGKAQSDDGRVHDEPIPAIYDRILAWSLGQELTARDFDQVFETARRVRAADRSRSRPLLCAAETELLRYSRELTGIQSAYRFPLATSLQLTDYGTWLRERPRLARPGTPFWTVIQTQPAASMRQQWAAFSAGGARGGIDSDALRLLVFTAVGAGVRGLEFASHSRLDAQDNDTRLRALTLAILNAELDLVEPWAAAGGYAATADSNDPHVKGVLLQYESSRLLVVTRVGPHAQYVPQHATSSSVSFVVPGVPESHDLIELTVGGVRPLKQKRVTGGTLITLADFDTTAFVLMTPDPAMVNTLSRRLTGIATRAADLQRELVARTLAEVESVERRLPADVRDETLSTGLIAAARQDLGDADAALRSGDRRAAFIAARRANTSLGQLERKHWERAAASLRSSAASPFVGSFGTLPDHWQLIATLRAKPEQANQLPAGDFEDLQAVVQAGWKHLTHPIEGVETSIEITPGGTSNGRSCLRMEVRPQDRQTATALLETAPVWITSPPVSVRRGEIVCVRGRARVATPVRGSVDGLMIVDSLGGEALAERFGQTNDWEEFVLYRAAPRDGEITVTFALTGYGEAMIDDVTIRPMRASTASPQSPTMAPAEQNVMQLAPPAATVRQDGTQPTAAPPSLRSRLDQAQRMQQIFTPRR